MSAGNESKAGPVTNRTTVERTSDRELVVTRTFDAPARLVFEAWSRPELFKKWWVPKSMGMTLLSCEIDARVGASTAWSSTTAPSLPSFSARMSK